MSLPQYQYNDCAITPLLCQHLKKVIFTYILYIYIKKEAKLEKKNIAIYSPNQRSYRPKISFPSLGISEINNKLSCNIQSVYMMKDILIMKREIN